MRVRSTACAGSGPERLTVCLRRRRACVSWAGMLAGDVLGLRAHVHPAGSSGSAMRIASGFRSRGVLEVGERLGRLARVPDDQEPPYSFAVTASAHDWAWRQEGICLYCVHCCSCRSGSRFSASASLFGSSTRLPGFAEPLLFQASRGSMWRGPRNTRPVRHHDSPRSPNGPAISPGPARLPAFANCPVQRDEPVLQPAGPGVAVQLLLPGWLIPLMESIRIARSGGGAARLSGPGVSWPTRLTPPMPQNARLI
jgi:hypothetical protein